VPGPDFWQVDLSPGTELTGKPVTNEERGEKLRAVPGG